MIALLGALLSLFLRDVATAQEIHQLVTQGRVEQLRKALGTTPSGVNEKDKEGRTPLHLAAAGGNAKVAAVLLESGADVSALGPLTIQHRFITQPPVAMWPWRNSC